jgi:hypothetical protein
MEENEIEIDDKTLKMLDEMKITPDESYSSAIIRVFKEFEKRHLLTKNDFYRVINVWEEKKI